MPYDRTEPARWWHGVEVAPPVPDEPGPWVLGPTPYGWQWRLAEPDVLVRAGDRLIRAGVVVWVHAVRHDPDAGFFAIAGGRNDADAVFLSEIGPAGSGKPWTLLARDPAPDPSDADLAEIVREELRALDRSEAASGGGGGSGPWRREPVVTGENGGKGGGGGGGLSIGGTPGVAVVSGAGGPGGYDAPPSGQMVRIYASDGTPIATLAPGTTSYVLGRRHCPAAGAVSDMRREARVAAIRRVRDAAAEVAGWATAYEAEGPKHELRDALDALAALDGEGGA